MTKPLEDEKNREAKLKEQQVEVNYNGNTEVLRPEALKIAGVDNLSTEEITSFLDLYLNYTTTVVDDVTSYEALDNQVTFRVEWINDSSVGIAFQTHDDCLYALRQLSTYSPIDEPTPDLTNQVYVSAIIQERESKSYNPVLAFRNHQSLFSRLGINKEENEEEQKMDEDESSIVLLVRQAFQSDRKVKNAALYSRYYLIHGEPDRKQRYREKRDRRKYDKLVEDAKDFKEDAPQEPQEPEVDLFADRLVGRSERPARSERSGGRPSKFKKYNRNDDEEDLFAHKLRERSPTRQ